MNRDSCAPQTIITGHTGADFDALAAMVAAQKLYPDAVLVMPQVAERGETHVFTDNLACMFGMRQPRECDFSNVSLLVVVDTHQASRVPHVADVLDTPGLRIHVYDHHPDSEDDLPAEKSVIRMWGSTTAILTECIREQGLELLPDEATMLGLGIYEDTGAFCFSSTTEHDLAAAAFLMASGMDLLTVTELTCADLTREQVHTLDILLRNAVTHSIHGVPVTVTEIALQNFVNDFAVLVRKLMDVENLRVVFTLAVMGDRIHIIARSNAPEVDVGQICAAFGGGGHPYAASAVVKDRPPAEVRSELMTLLVSSIAPHSTVGQHMTAPAITLDETQTIEQAAEIMNRYGLKAAPVLSATDASCAGLLEQQTALRALSHKLGTQPVTEYMLRRVRTLPPEADLYDAVEIILKDRQRLVPVLTNGRVAGVLTRTDILRLLVDDTLHIPEGIPHVQGHQERNIRGLLTAQLPEEHVDVLRETGRLADELGVPVYAVGGFVRDLLMRRPNLDIDLSVEGDGIAFARALAARLGGRVRTHSKFKTAIVFYRDREGGEQRLDVATARLEYYEYPGALPAVELSSIKMDLFRRDFTINALAVQVNAARFGMLIDPFGAQRDIKDKRIAVLHSLSFVEDPTRILRAVRFEQRFGFRITQQTERLVKNALSLDLIGKISGARLFNELRHVFDEKEAPSCIRRIDGWHIWKSLHPALMLSPAKDIVIDATEEVLGWYRLLYQDPVPRNWIVYLLGMTTSAKYHDVAEALDSLGCMERHRAEFIAIREQSKSAAKTLTEMRRKKTSDKSRVYEALSRVPVEGLLYLMACHGQKHNIGQDVSLFLTRLQDARSDISGADLTALGEAPGPRIGHVLRQVHHAKLDGRVGTREEQLALAQDLLREGRARETADSGPAGSEGQTAAGGRKPAPKS